MSVFWAKNLIISANKNTQKIERKHLTLRTRIKRLARKKFVPYNLAFLDRWHQGD